LSDHRRFFISPGQIDGDMAAITGDAARQMRNVLRLKAGDSICLLDGQGNELDARITALSAGLVSAEVLGSRKCPGEPSLRLTLAVCLPKGDRIELIVQKCTELGISELIPVISERTITRIDPSKAPERIERWRRIAREAAEQSGRGMAPEIRGMVGFADLVEPIGRLPLALLAWEDEGRTPLRNVLRANGSARSAMVVIGPEGGLTEDEVRLAVSAGARCVSLGRRVLRCETAAIAACAAIMYELERDI